MSLARCCRPVDLTRPLVHLAIWSPSASRKDELQFDVEPCNLPQPFHFLYPGFWRERSKKAVGEQGPTMTAEPDTKAAEAPPQTSGREDGELNQDNEETDSKHPLEHRWTLWYDSGSGKSQPQSWGKSLRTVYTFGTVEDFWCLYNNVKPPSWLSPGTDLQLFKEGVEPKWEDPQCENGGKWTVQIPKAPNGKQTLDAYWLNALLACIGEQFDEGDDICGIVVNLRAKQDRLGIWTKTAHNEAAQVSIARQLKDFLDVPEGVKLGYLPHADAAKQGKVRDRYTV